MGVRNMSFLHSGLVKMCGDTYETSVETSTAAYPSSPAKLVTATVGVLQMSLDKTLMQLALPMTRP